MYKNKIFFIFLFITFPAVLLFSKSGNSAENINDPSAPDTALYVKYADSFMHNYPGQILYDTTKLNWNYEQGLMLYALWNVWKETNNDKYFNYLKRNIDYYITDDGNIKAYKLEKYRLDDIAPGRVLLDLYKLTKEEKYKKAARLLRKQLSEQPRTKEGGFWHKKIYIQQMWLDGLYMAEPFYAQYAKMFDEPEDYDDIAHQFILMAEKAEDPETGLFYHGWDSSKKEKWADSETGTSPSFWGRAMGWYLMGIVDVLDYFPKDHPKREKLIAILKKLSAALLKYQDKKSNLWFVVVDKGGKEGNYLEASSSAMFMYAYAKGARKGYLDKKYFTEAVNILEGLKNNLITKDSSGYYNLNNIIGGAGLGGNPYRAGDYDYYVNEKRRTNDFKGLGPLILGSLEISKGLVK